MKRQEENQKIKSVYVVTTHGASGYVVGRNGVTSIKKQPLYITGDGFEHYFVWKESEVLATINCLAPCEVTYFTNTQNK